MTFIANIFPLLATIGVAALVVYGLLSKKSLAAGSESAGPVIRPTRDVHGLSTESQDVAAISSQISNNPGAVVEMMTELCQLEGLEADLKPWSSRGSITSLVEQLEGHLEIHPGSPLNEDFGRS